MTRAVRDTGVSRAEAGRLLSAADGQVKVAIVMGRLGITRDEAETRIASAGGVLRRALEETEGAQGVAGTH
jgi:N-acetylmuramic acid 6-phosphate (MurNAc-6-P) etherase